MKETSRRRREKRKLIIPLIIFLCLATVVCTILPPSFGKTKQFVDENGNIMEGSISEKIFADINGVSLGMFIMARDSGKPVLLFLGGGPGIPQYFLEQEFPAGLENEFVVCYLEYRGTSLSFKPDIAVESMTIEQYVSDTVEVTNYLRNRFGQKKIYLIGHSFGTYVGLNAVKEHPELYHAYIAMSQLTNQRESEILAYNYMYGQYRLQANEKMAKRFEEYPIADSEDAYNAYSMSGLRDTAMHDLGVGTTRAMRSVISGIFFPSLRLTAYTPMERINIWRGKAFAQATPVAADSRNFNAFEEIPEIDVPIYFFAGIYDYTVSYSLQKEYYEHVQAPLKAFYTFNYSAHSPLYEETEKAMSILSQDVLAGEASLSD